MPNFEEIAIDVTAAQLEKVAKLNIVEELSDDSANNGSVPTAIAVTNYTNEKFANCVPIMLNNEATPALPKLYAQDSKNGTNKPYLYPCDRTDGYMEHLDDGGAGVGYSEFAKCVAIRNENGNLLSDFPTRKNEVANKLYVDTAIGEIDTALDGIIAIQNKLIGGDVV